MDTPPQETTYHVARDGQVIGSYRLPELAEKFRDGSVNPTDYYITEGGSEWKPVGDLKSQFADLESQRIKAEKERYKAEVERRQAEERQRITLAAAERDKAQKLAAENKAAMERAQRERAKEQQLRDKVWQCLNCKQSFSEDNPAIKFPDASGLADAIGLMIIACIVGAGALGTFFSRGEGTTIMGFIFASGAFILLLVAIGKLISYGVELGLQRFHSYRPHCPKCSSALCTKGGAE